MADDKKGCPFRHLCKYYAKDSFTCNDATKDWELMYCGYYREHFKFKLMGEMDQLLGAVDFISKSKLAGP